MKHRKMKEKRIIKSDFKIGIKMNTEYVLFDKNNVFILIREI